MAFDVEKDVEIARRSTAGARLPLAAQADARAFVAAGGHVDGELLGAHMVGPEVTELIQGYVIGRKLETTEADLMETVFPHPTLSEAMHEAVLDAYGKALHF